jgi:hypothetical protein
MITHTAIPTGSTATKIAEASWRHWFVIQNLSDTDLWIALDGSADVTTDAGAKPGLKLAAGARLGSGDLGLNEARTDFRGPFFAVHAGGAAKSVVVHEV